jgi:hypothetical protein
LAEQIAESAWRASKPKASWVDGEALSVSGSMPLAAALLARAKHIGQPEQSMTREDRALGEAEVLLVL